ncbi:MAG: lipoate--protein ligase family protein [Candidatus Brockarchaeota archaeon]|nr:lipoate--protein ligase family protein [Candidatus Brockarchaeota archaeon]
MLRVRAELVGGKIKDVMLSGDFFMVPENALPELESALAGADLERDGIEKRIFDFYEASKIQTPGLSPGDFVDAIMKLGKDARETG